MLIPYPSTPVTSLFLVMIFFIILPGNGHHVSSTKRISKLRDLPNHFHHLDNLIKNTNTNLSDGVCILFRTGHMSGVFDVIKLRTLLDFTSKISGMGQSLNFGMPYHNKQ